MSFFRRLHRRSIVHLAGDTIAVPVAGGAGGAGSLVNTHTRAGIY